MIAVLQNEQSKHIGFILFSKDDSKCILQIIPKDSSLLDSEIFRELDKYSHHNISERSYEIRDNEVVIDGGDLSDLTIKLEDTNHGIIKLKEGNVLVTIKDK